MILKEIKKRGLPCPLSVNGKDIASKEEWSEKREEIKNLLSNICYGAFPRKPDKFECKNVKLDIEDFCAASGVLERKMMLAYFGDIAFPFAFNFSYPNKPGKFPLVIYIDYSSEMPNRYLPIEDIIDRDIAVASFKYTDITADNGDMTDGVLGRMFKTGQAKVGKLMTWAWAASLILDYAVTRDNIDTDNIAVAGHGFLGTAALLAGAYDERFAFVYPNSSSHTGIALNRGNGCLNEHINRYGYMYSPAFSKYGKDVNALPYDQHFLAALVAPRKLYVANAAEDEGTDAVSEFLSCAAVNGVYKLYGECGLVHANEFPKEGDVMHDGSIGYHMRRGTNYMNRYDWDKFIDFIKLYLN